MSFVTSNLESLPSESGLDLVDVYAEGRSFKRFGESGSFEGAYLVRFTLAPG